MKTFKQFAEQASAYFQLRYGSTPAKATPASIDSGITNALENPNTSQSVTSEKGKTGITGSGYIQYSGSLKRNPEPSPSSGAPATPPRTRTTPTSPIRDTRGTTPTTPTSPIRDTRGTTPTSPIRGN